MKIAPASHRERPWRVHTLAPDFQLLDVWQFDLAGRRADIKTLLACFWSSFAALSNSRLARARLRIGRTMGWDGHDFSLAIPGCRETCVADRLSDADRAASRARSDAPSPVPAPTVRTVYLFDREALYEASNDTIHLLLHIGLLDENATLAVYIKSRGLFSRFYMAAIEPFRRLFVYPAFTRLFEAAWKQSRY
jgi:hypothetical protein